MHSVKKYIARISISLFLMISVIYGGDIFFAALLIIKDCYIHFVFLFIATVMYISLGNSMETMPFNQCGNENKRQYLLSSSNRFLALQFVLAISYVLNTLFYIYINSDLSNWYLTDVFGLKYWLSFTLISFAVFALLSYIKKSNSSPFLNKMIIFKLKSVDNAASNLILCQKKHNQKIIHLHMTPQWNGRNLDQIISTSIPAITLLVKKGYTVNICTPMSLDKFLPAINEISTDFIFYSNGIKAQTKRTLAFRAAKNILRVKMKNKSLIEFMLLCKQFFEIYKKCKVKYDNNLKMKGILIIPLK